MTWVAEGFCIAEVQSSEVNKDQRHEEMPSPFPRSREYGWGLVGQMTSYLRKEEKVFVFLVLLKSSNILS